MSANDFIDACSFIPSSGGTGNFVVSAAVQGYQTPASAGAVNGNVYSYRAESVDKSQWEDGFGAYTSSSVTLARTTITANSNGNTSAVNFSAAPNVYITAASADLKNASLLSTGTLADGRLSSNVPHKNAANAFTANQTITGGGASTNALTVTNSGTNGAALNIANANGQCAVFSGSAGGGGDIMTHRGNGSGAIFLGNSGGTYLFFDGSQSYSLGGSAGLSVNGIAFWNAGAVGATNTAKAWVNFAGATGSLNASYNVSSVTRVGTGNYTVNLANAMPDANYSTSVSTGPTSGAVALLYTLGRDPSGVIVAPTTSAFRIVTFNYSGGGLADGVYVNAQIFR
jgi:hypothetical protein